MISGYFSKLIPDLPLLNAFSTYILYITRLIEGLNSLSFALFFKLNNALCKYPVIRPTFSIVIPILRSVRACTC